MRSILKYPHYSIPLDKKNENEKTTLADLSTFNPRGGATVCQIG
jgi:hypothetical protein